MTRPRHLIGTAGLLLVGALLLTGCSTAPQPPPAPSDPPAATLPFDATAVEAAFQEAAAERDLIGALVYLRAGESELELSTGTAEYGTETTPTADQQFRVGSNTKTWTGTIILQLVDEGRLALDDAVADYRSDVPGGEAITIEQLLDMTSGLANYTESAAWEAEFTAAPARVWTPQELLAFALDEPPYFAPGSGFHYSNTNTILLGLIAEQLTGETLQDLMTQRLFEPLGLVRTTLPATDDASLAAPYAHGYAFMAPPGGLTEDEALTPADAAAWAAGELLPDDRTLANPSWAGAAGAGVSTARELATWVEALTEGELLDPALQERRITEFSSLGGPGTAQGKGAGYGMAIARFGDWIGHNGELPGYQSHMVRNLDLGVTLIAWVNLAPGSDGTAQADAIAARVEAAITDAYRHD